MSDKTINQKLAELNAIFPKKAKSENINDDTERRLQVTEEARKRSRTYYYHASGSAGSGGGAAGFPYVFNFSLS